MSIFAEFFASLLAFYYSFTHSYAAAIVLLTVTVMIAVLPLTLKATRSMIILQKVAPELQKMQDKFKNDRQKLNEEMMAFYKENKINPLSGCFPLLAQIPIFFILYQTLNGLTRRDAEGISIPKYLDQGSEMYRDLVAANGEMVSFGMDFAHKAISPHNPWYTGIPFFALIAIMVFAQFWQQRQISSRATTQADTPQAEMMRKFQKIMPPVFGVISISFPAALVLYWTAQSVIRVFQQWAMYRFDPKLKNSVDHARDDAKAHLRGSGSKTKTAAKSLTEAKPPRAKKEPNGKSKRKGR